MASAAAERNTVWVGFMDTVPVIGTVKEMVEWVLALYEGNKVVLLEKEKVIFQLVGETLDEHMEKRLALTEKPEKAGAAASKSALMDIQEVKQDELLGILSYDKEGQKEPAKVPEKEKAERQKKLQELNEDLLKKIHLVNPDYRLHEPLKEELSRSNRGEHVFNNGILKFHSSKVLQDFFTKNSFRYYYDRNQLIIKLSKHTLESDTEEEIQTNMVVHFDEDECYVNANAILYGVYCQELRKAFHNILCCRDPVLVPGQLKERLELIIDYMNNFEIYVDQFAKVKWINNNRAKREKFDQVKDEVVKMYKNDRGWDWIIIVMFQLTLQLGFLSGEGKYFSLFYPF